MTDPELEVTLFPDPVLRKVALPVEEFDQDLAHTVEAMFERMRASSGVGLAAPQVGLRRRILVLNPTGEPEDDLALINVTITDRFGPESAFEEGCLSFPEIYGEVFEPLKDPEYFARFVVGEQEERAAEAKPQHRRRQGPIGGGFRVHPQR